MLSGSGEHCRLHPDGVNEFIRLCVEHDRPVSCLFIVQLCSATLAGRETLTTDLHELLDTVQCKLKIKLNTFRQLRNFRGLSVDS